MAICWDIDKSEYVVLDVCDRKFIILLMSQQVQQFEMTQIPL